jgi:hypothetical protein
MRKAIRVVFYVHVTIALYCLAMVILDGMDNRPFSIIPPLPVIAAMALAAIILPLVNLVLALRAHVNYGWILLGHILVGGVQILFGIIPLL